MFFLSPAPPSMSFCLPGKGKRKSESLNGGGGKEIGEFSEFRWQNGDVLKHKRFKFLFDFSQTQVSFTQSVTSEEEEKEEEEERQEKQTTQVDLIKTTQTRTPTFTLSDRICCFTFQVYVKEVETQVKDLLVLVRKPCWSCARCCVHVCSTDTPDQSSSFVGIKAAAHHSVLFHPAALQV